MDNLHDSFRKDKIKVVDTSIIKPVVSETFLTGVNDSVSSEFLTQITDNYSKEDIAKSNKQSKILNSRKTILPKGIDITKMPALTSRDHSKSILKKNSTVKELKLPKTIRFNSPLVNLDS